VFTCLDETYLQPDETASDLICEADLNMKDVSEDLSFYFGNLTDANTSLTVHCCNNGKNLAKLGDGRG
jgi:hypothetical protein